MPKIHKEMTLMDILKAGGSVFLFNDQIMLRGDPTAGYFPGHIRVRSTDPEGESRSKGPWSLDTDGLQSALDDAAEIVSRLQEG